ncbi:MAG: hypothetical protein ACJ71W_16925 [Terriglobales bacterium]
MNREAATPLEAYKEPSATLVVRGPCQQQLCFVAKYAGLRTVPSEGSNEKSLHQL